MNKPDLVPSHQWKKPWSSRATPTQRVKRPPLLICLPPLLDLCTVTKTVHDACVNGAEYWNYTINGGGHTGRVHFHWL